MPRSKRPNVYPAAREVHRSSRQSRYDRYHSRSHSDPESGATLLQHSDRNDDVDNCLIRGVNSCFNAATYLCVCAIVLSIPAIIIYVAVNVIYA